ncbi:MAG: hypothetical protein JNM62_13835 [Flavobacteriales bacterium]|nr:hypothetical protein [Flavobacteriales bacterium]
MTTLTGNEPLAYLLSLRDAAGTFLITRAAVRCLLERYVQGDLSREQVFHVCDVLEWMEHVVYDTADEDVIADALFRMATPPAAQDQEDRVNVEQLRRVLAA